MRVLRASASLRRNSTAISEDFGLRVGARMRATAVGLTGLAAMHAATVRDALKIISSSLKTTNTGATTVLDVRGADASLLHRHRGAL